MSEGVVFGVPDALWGERVCAAVIAAPGVRLDGDAVRAWLRGRLAGYQVPKQVVVVDELPRTGSGKVVRRALAAALGLAP
ncbi:MAG: hypothetical protein M3O86_05990 [Actinomycetota bacterium]|nr:hypothetical protein [Actinomycetota bacterium]